MPKFKDPIVFVNYRRDDSESEAGRINNDLENAFGKGFVFQDRDDLTAGAKWIDKLVEAGKVAKVIIAVIGPNWLQVQENGKSRLEDPEDWVRKELVQAIKSDKVIIPVMVNGGKLPSKDEMPEALHKVTDYQAFELRSDKWNIDFGALQDDIAQISGVKTLEQVKKEDKEKSFRKKILILSGSLIAASLFLVWFLFIKTDAVSPSTSFCPEFEETSTVKTLLYPFAEVDGGHYNLELSVKEKIADISQELNILNEVKIPHIAEDDSYDNTDAKLKCKSCLSDIFLTGTSYKNAEDKYGFSTTIAFCDPKFKGVHLDQTNLKITVAPTEIENISNNHDIAESLEYAIEVFLGIYKIKNNELEEGIKILEGAIKKHPEQKMIEERARQVIWQAQYRLKDKVAAVKTLDKMYHLDESKTTPLLAKASINLEQAEYTDAIKDLNVVINQTNNVDQKDQLLEKRADTYVELKQYDKAKQDYEAIETRPVSTKLKQVNSKIRLNQNQINSLRGIQNPTVKEQASLIKLLTENGQVLQASQLLQKTDLSALRDTVTGESPINAATINAIKAQDTTLSPKVINKFNRFMNKKKDTRGNKNH